MEEALGTKNKVVRTDFKIWFVNYFLAPFSWSRWTDISTFDYAGGYLLQGKVNKRTNAKKFKITEMRQCWKVAKTSVSMDKLKENGLIDDKVKYNE